MSHIDTLKVYEELISSGLTSEQAHVQVKAYEAMGNSILFEMKEWFIEAKRDFASQKMVSILGGLILLVGVASIGLLWNLSVDMRGFNVELQTIQRDVEKLNNKMGN